MLKTNQTKVVIQSVQGSIQHPLSGYPYRISHEGIPYVLPATGGITYNVKLGDPAFGWAGDHIEPGVTMRNSNDKENAALHLLSCIGNEARVISGDAKGAKGFVTGGHGGVEHVLVYFKQADMEMMSVGDKILIKACGQGLELSDHSEVKVMNIDPDLLLKIGITEQGSKIRVPVAATAPAHLMGSGIGAPSAYKGDYDIMTGDKEEVKKYGLDQLKFGDLVLLQDCDNSFGRGFLKGAVSIGVVVHSDCVKMGHGPGITTIMTCKKAGVIDGVNDENANIAKYLNI
ncbi:DUF4438 domain-containing protein [Metallumcola ferriviriculae]|uniref:DUF4438 domain-containing protein n=1 Tax=Metallumcola ferriviriculae TaxID=3039180 RepID=A0AAU0UJU5_9FIRM|nr:DUF4438 domain-containing protein [Desulfitibacteraceae bacterium MK1]